MIKQIAHICLLSSNLEATENFYCQLLGLKKQFDFISDGQKCGFYLKICEGNYIEVFQSNTIQTLEKQPIQHFCLEVTDMEALINQVQSQGHAITDKKMGEDHTWQCWIKDPDNVDIEFHQYTQDSYQYSGQNCVL